MKRQRQGSGKRAKRTYALLLTGLTALLIVGTASVYTMRHATATSGPCSAPSTDYGTDTLSLNVPATATYVLWTRMMVPDTTNNAINVQIDNASCYNVGGSAAISANTWTWVNYQNGTTSSPISVSLTAGTHAIKYIGTKPGVSVDRVILASDTNCTPTGVGDDCATGDATPPTISLTAPAAGSTVNDTVTLSASASDTSGISQVVFKVDGQTVNTDMSSPYSYSWNSTTVTNGSHTIVAQATDKADNIGTSISRTITVSNTLPCTAAPSTPTGLHTTAVSYTSATVAWSASTPASGCVLAGYKVYRDGTLVKTVTSGTSYADTGLALKHGYSYKVAAYDSTGHTSAQSAALAVTTLADTTAPSAPTGLAAPVITATQVALTWTASSDNVGTTGYTIYRNGTQVGQSATASYTDKNLAPNTTYSYTIKASDASGNVSAASTAGNFKTLVGVPANIGDLNSSGKVDVYDLSILLSNWNKTGVPVTQGDANADGTVSIFDLSILLSHWGTQ